MKIKGDLLQLELDLKKQFDTSGLLADVSELKVWRTSYLKDFDELDKDVNKIRTSQDDSNKKLKEVSTEVTELVGWRANTLKQEFDKLRKYLDNSVTISKAESDVVYDMAKKTSVSVDALVTWRVNLAGEIEEMEKNLKKVLNDTKSLKDESSTVQTSLKTLKTEIEAMETKMNKKGAAELKEEFEEFKSKVQPRLKSLKTEMEAMEAKTNKIGSAVKKLQKKEDDDF